MKITLEQALKFTLKWEGNFTDHPNDLGGPTNKGIIQTVYDKYRTERDLHKRSVQFITDSEVNDIYEKYYWEPIRAKWLQAPLALVLFDTAVNFGVSGAIRRLQKSLNVKITGQWTQEISDNIHQADALKIALDICKLRIAWRHQRVRINTSQKVFLRGWLNRDNDLIKTISNIKPFTSMNDEDLIDIIIDYAIDDNEVIEDNYEESLINILNELSQEDSR